MVKWKYFRLILVLVGVFAFAHFLSATIVDFDFRERGRSPVAIEVVTVTVDYDVDDYTGTATITSNGNVEQVVITVPDLNVTGATATVKLKDENGGELYSKATCAGNNTITVDRPSSTTLIAGTTTVEVTTTNAQTEDQDVIVELYLR